MPNATRREVLTVAAVTVTLPMLQSALGGLRQAKAAPPRPGPSTQPAEKPGWFTTTLKLAELKDNEFTAVSGHAIVVSRAGKTVEALSNICTHKQCPMAPKAGAKTIECACHKSQFNLDGSVAKAPAKTPLPHYAIRADNKGFVEIDPGKAITKEDKNFTVEVPA